MKAGRRSLVAWIASGLLRGRDCELEQTVPGCVETGWRAPAWACRAHLDPVDGVRVADQYSIRAGFRGRYLSRISVGGGRNMEVEEPKPKRNFWNPFQKIEKYEQAVDMVKGLVAVSALAVLQFVIVGAFYAFQIETDFTPAPIDEFERWFMVGFSAVLVVLAGLAGWAVNAKQWWWITIILFVWGVFDGVSRFAPLLSGEYSSPFGAFMGILLLVVSIAGLRGRIAMSHFQRREDPDSEL